MSFLSKIQIRANKEPRGHFDFGKYASNLNLWVNSTEREPLKEISILLKSLNKEASLIETHDSSEWRIKSLKFNTEPPAAMQKAFLDANRRKRER